MSRILAAAERQDDRTVNGSASLDCAAESTQEFVDRGEDPSCADVITRLQAALFDWALHPKMHITTPNAKIAAYAAQQLQVRNGVLIGIWDEAELGAIREKIGMKP